MDDPISRQAVINTITECVIYMGGNPYSACSVLKKRINALPTVDAVPVVRCKDCKYNPNPPECGNAVCVLFYGMTDQRGFCHHGERREQDDS